MTEQKKVLTAATEEPTPAAEPQVQGIPSVADKKRRPVNSTTLLAIAAGLAVIAGLCTFVYLKLMPGTEEKTATQATEAHYTSSKTLTVNPVPPKPAAKEAPKAEPVVKAEEKPVIEERTNGRYSRRDEQKREPTLEERRFAAPLMGEGAASGGHQPELPQINTGDNSRPRPDGGKLSAMLNAVETPPVKARGMGNRSLILPKGTFIDCILETRVNTSVPGMTSCVIPQDIYSANGKVLLLERGSKAIGEYKGSVANGLDRIFVLWTEIQTPKGVRVQLDSPGADALGGSGLEGYTDYHWWARFGNALLFSLIQDGFDYLIATQEENNGGMSYYENSSDGVDEIIREAMRQSGNIPPTLTKNQGERIGIFVARDLDFSSVYRLTPSAGRN